MIEIDIDKIVVVVGCRGEQIVNRFDYEYEETPLRYVTKEVQLGLGHAVAQAKSILEGDFVVHNGDDLIGNSLDREIQTHNQDAFDATLLVEKASIDEAQRTGVVTLNDEETVRRLVEKPEKPTSDPITIGVYILPEEIFPTYRSNWSIKSRGNRTDRGDESVPKSRW